MRIGTRRALLGRGGAAQYTLYDVFATDRAAGAINGTPSESPATTGGGQTRTVVDSASHLSISGGSWVFDGLDVTNGDPGMWYPQGTLAAGNTVAFRITTPAVTNKSMDFGIDNNQAGLVQSGMRFRTTAFLSALSAATANVAAYSANTTYEFALVMRVTGLYYFIKGGAFTNWTLLWADTTAVSATPFPAIMQGTSPAAFTGNYVKSFYVPLPNFAALVYDTFTRANGALGSTETADTDALVIPAYAWNFTAGVWAVATNVAVGTPNTGADVITNGSFASDTAWTKGAGWTIAGGVGVATASSASITEANGVIGAWYKATFTLGGFSAGTLALQFGGTGTLGVAQGANGTYTETNLAIAATAVGIKAAGGCTATLDDVSFLPLTLKDLFSSVTVLTQDVLAEVAVTSVAGVATQSGLVLNLDSVAAPANFVIAFVDRGKATANLYKCVAGVYTSVISAAITYSVGAVLRVSKIGTGYGLYYNNLIVGAISTISDAGIVSNLNHGLFSTDSRNSLKNFTTWARGVNNEYAILNNF